MNIATSEHCDIERSGISQDAHRAAHIADILKALSHPIRLRIISLLDAGPMHVNAMAEALECQQAVISQQLRILRMRGLVQATRVNGFANYELAEPRLRELLRCMEGCTVPHGTTDRDQRESE